MNTSFGDPRYTTSRSAMCLVVTLLWLVAPTGWAASVTTFDDIEYWVGDGANRAALVFDWDEASSTDEAIVWGYRWDGTATGEDMLFDILEADPRLYAKFSPPSSAGFRLYGWGYDRNENCQFDISDGTSFGSERFIFSDAPDLHAPGAISTDPQDDYAEGWWRGFWHYGISSGNPFDGGSWDFHGAGMSQRTLADGDWDGWAFAAIVGGNPNDPDNFVFFPENPHTALPPLTADFDCDADVDGSDFLAWQRGFGITAGAEHSQGDATNDGRIDSDDLLEWMSQYGSSRASSGTLPHTASVAVPEPTSSILALCGLVFSLFTFVSKRGNVS